jgi:LmbE family N-acetylglucosaminyl deacetylase
LHHVYLSPHLDDAVLSCGATIARQVDTGDQVDVLTIMTGTPSGVALSAYAKELHVKAGNPEDMMATRRAEDEAACAVLGAILDHLKFLDAPYRVDPSNGAFLYTSDEELMAGQIHPADAALVGDLIVAIVELIKAARAILYAPLGAGGHVDHLLAREVALGLQDGGYTVLFYEDYPYVEDGYKLVAALARSADCGMGWRAAELCYGDPQDVALKCEAIARYTSQVPILFGDATQVNERVLAYMTRVGGDRPAERFWETVWPAAGQRPSQPPRSTVSRQRGSSRWPQ